MGLPQDHERRPGGRLGQHPAASRDYGVLEESVDFDTNRFAAWYNTRAFGPFSSNARIESRKTVNFSPAPGEPPDEADELRVTFNTTVRPGRRHVIDGNYLRTELEERRGGATILVNDIARTRWNWQLTQQLTLRTIFQYEKTRSDEEKTSRDSEESFNADFLLIYLVNPWTALYVGYNSNYSDLDLIEGRTVPR